MPRKERHDLGTIKIWSETLRLLRLIHAELNGEPMVKILDRLVRAEYARVMRVQHTRRDLSLKDLSGSRKQQLM